MSNVYSCSITIDNSKNDYDLNFTGLKNQQGTFSSPPVMVPKNTVAPKPIVISNSSGGSAGATINWVTGPGNSSVISMTILNSSGTNEAQMTFTYNGTSSGTLYGTSFLYAGVGSGPMARDFVPGSSSSGPVNVAVTIVQNAFAGTNPGFLPGITKVVMLMLENRSLDHLMGQLYTESSPASNFIPSASASTAYMGLGDKPTFTNLILKTTISETAYPMPKVADPDIPDPDPGEAYEYVNNQLYYPNYDYSAPPPMTGFLYDYYTNAGIFNGGAGYPACNQIMGFYTSDQLPIISGLAQQYAISDAWFCSVPSQTYANRAYSLAGTTSGFVDNGPDLPFPKENPNRTLFNVMMDCGNFDWMIYTYDAYWLNSSFVTYEFETMDSLPSAMDPQSISSFLNACTKGTLPAFSYIEPAWFGGEIGQNWNGNDYHPTANLIPGEQALNTVYQALTKSPDWDTTLFIVTFDEHGGTMDHFPPPPCTPPDGMTYSGDGLSFNFDRLGVRVPTLLISPQIQAGTVFRSPTFGTTDYIAFDHTSLLMTILGWQGIDVSGGVLGARAAIAPDFSGVLSGGTVVNPGSISITPHSETPERQAENARAPLNDLQKRLRAALAHSISGGEKGGPEHVRVWQEISELKTIDELHAYVKAARQPKNAAK